VLREIHRGRRSKFLILGAAGTRVHARALFARANPNQHAKQHPHKTKPEDLAFRQAPTLADCYPGSTKEYATVEHNGRVLQVPFRRVHLTDGTTFDLYDTSGPQVR
jgi:hypothetical protein